MNVQLKAALIALSVFTIFDAAVWQGRYRELAVHKVSWTAHWVMTRNWS